MVVSLDMQELDIFQLYALAESGRFGSFPKIITGWSKIFKGGLFHCVCFLALQELDIFRLYVLAESGRFGSFLKIITGQR